MGMSDVNSIYNSLLQQGVPAGIAIEQARAIAASRESPHTWGAVDTRTRNALIDHGMMGGLSPGVGAALNHALYDSRSYDSPISAEVAGLPSEHFGGWRGFGGDTEAQYNAYLQALTQNIRNEAAMRGQYVSQQRAFALAQNLADPKDVFERLRNVGTGGPSEPLKDLGAEIGMDVPIAYVAGLAEGEGRFGNDIRRILGGQSPPGSRPMGPIASNLIPALGWGTALGSSLYNNDRGDNWSQSLRRLSRYDQDLGVDVGDYLRFGTAVPTEALANVAAWSTIPAQAVTQMRQTPGLANAVGALSRVGPAASGAIGAARLAPDMVIAGLGERLGANRSVYELAKRHRDIQDKWKDDVQLRQGDGVATRWGDLTNLGRRGLLGRLMTGHDPEAGTAERLLTTMGDTFQTAGDLMMTPVNIAANTAGAVGRGLEALPFVPQGTGATARNLLTPDQWPRMFALSRNRDRLEEQIVEGGLRNFESDSQRKQRRAKERSEGISDLTRRPSTNPYLNEQNTEAWERRRLESENVHLTAQRSHLKEKLRQRQRYVESARNLSNDERE